MAMPRKLKQMNLFNDGNSYQGQCGTVTLPKLTRKLEAWRGGGMDGSVKVDLGMGDDGIQIDWTIGGYDLIAIRQYGITSASGVMLRWAGAAQRDDTSEVMAIEVVVRGRHEEIDFGEAAPGEDTEQKVVTTCSYYKLVVNGREELEIDLLNMIFRVDGIDRYEEMRRAIGL